MSGAPTGGSAPYLGKVALVTGAGSGIGRAAALGLARDDAQVIAVGRRQKLLDEVAAHQPDRIMAAACDVADEAAMQHLFADITAKHGPVDILVSAAGIYPQDTIADFDMQSWRSTVDINLTGAALAMHYALPSMLERDYGRIITLGSKSAHTPGAVTSAYSASKAGVEALTRAVAHEILWKRQYRPDVHVNVLIPGPTETGLLGRPEAEPGKHQTPDDVYPFIRALIDRPRRGGSGQVVMRRKIISRGDKKLIAKQALANLRGALKK